MKKKMRSVILAVFAMAFCCMAFFNTAKAAEIACNGVKVTINLEGDAPDVAEDYIVKLKADDVSYPMPESSENGEYTLTVTGAKTVDLPEIVYNKVGIYTYTIWQEKGTAEDVKYDEKVYELTVQVVNAEDGKNLEVVAILNQNGEEEKQLEVEFTNQYPPEPTPTPTPQLPVQTGDDAPIALYLIIAVVAIICFVVALRKNFQHE